MQITLDEDFYTPRAIEEIAIQFAEYLSVGVRSNDAMQLNITVTAAHILESAEIINAFLNNALLLSIQEKFHHER